ncbi:unnamed protein product [Bathycoccus prasinos]
MDGRFRQHQHRGHRQTMSSEYVFGVKNPFAKFMSGGSQEEEEDQEDRGGEEEEEEQLEEEKSASANAIEKEEEEGDEMEEGSETTSNKDEQEVRLLKKGRLSDDRESGNKVESLTESEPPPKVTGHFRNNNSSNSSGKEPPSGGRTSRMSRLISPIVINDSYKVFEDDGEDEQQAQIEQKNVVRRSATTGATIATTSTSRHFRSLSVVSAAKFERDGSNNGKEPNDLRASIFQALEKSNNNNRDDVQQKQEKEEDRPSTPFDDTNCCPTCFEEYQEDNPKITLACAHHFHLACIVEWNERGHSECPTCMTDVGFYMDDDE